MSYLVPQSLAGNDGDLIAESLVGLEVQSELWVVSLNDDLCGLLDGLIKLVLVVIFGRLLCGGFGKIIIQIEDERTDLCSDATHFGGF